MKCGIAPLAPAGEGYAGGQLGVGRERNARACSCKDLSLTLINVRFTKPPWKFKRRLDFLSHSFQRLELHWGR